MNIEDTLYWKTRPVDDRRKDWKNEKGSWLEEYWESRNHPHRQLILQALKKLEPFKRIIEIGCNCGPNLALIKKNYPDVDLMGIDVNKEAIAMGLKFLPEVSFANCSIQTFPYVLYSFDIVLIDAVFMYLYDNEIVPVLRSINNIARKAIIIVDWKGTGINYGHYARDYKHLLETETAFKKVEEIKITQEYWPSKNWSDIGYIWIAEHF